MKRYSVLLAALALWAAPVARAADAATEERLNKIAGQIDDLIADQKAQREQIAALAKEISSLREEQSKPGPSYVSPDELKRLAAELKEVDRKRLDDYEKIHSDLLKLKQGLTALPPVADKRHPVPPPDRPVGDKPVPSPAEQGFEYVIQRGDTLSVIVQAYRDKNIKITTDQILKANPGLLPEKLKVGQKIFIPAPQS
ncbi:Peptidoglycan-binding LysM [Verrucomicrobia bacterium]|nr:Peptidoglycan-binding LysM [Verrucomicrobiota bacterium]